MNNIKVFSNSKFGNIRVAGTPEQPMFCLTDLCKALDIKNVSDCKSRLKQDGIGSTEVIDSLGRKQKTTFINESNLYRCVFQSRKSDAIEFQDWVTEEVLPSIRTTGSYSVSAGQLPDFANPAEAARAWADQYEQNVQKQKLLEEQKPKVEFFDTVAESKTAIEMKEVANVLNFHKIGRNKLFQILRDNKILTHKNQPYQRYIDCGYFRTIEQEWQRPDGDTNISIKTLVYQTGVDYIRQLLLKQGYKPNPKEND